MKHKRDQEKIRLLAIERIKHLFYSASVAGNESALAKRYVTLARKIAMKSNIRLPSELKRKFCGHCNSFFNSKNSRIRTRDGKLISYCLECKKFSRIPLAKKRKISSS